MKHRLFRVVCTSLEAKRRIRKRKKVFMTIRLCMKKKRDLYRNISEHMLKEERWLVVPPGDSNNPMAFFSEDKAVYVATGIANNANVNVDIDHQRLQDGEWVSVSE